MLEGGYVTKKIKKICANSLTLKHKGRHYCVICFVSCGLGSRSHFSYKYSGKSGWKTRKKRGHGGLFFMVSVESLVDV